MKLVRKFSLLISLLCLLPLSASSMEKRLNFDDQISAQNAIVLAMNDTQKADTTGDKLYRRPFYNPFLFSPFFYNPYSIYPYGGFYPYNTFSSPFYFQQRRWDYDRRWPRRH